MRHQPFETVDLLGVLATYEETSKEIGKENMFINKVEEIQFYVKLLSSEPYDFPSLDSKKNYFSCFANNLENFEDDKSLSELERMAALEKFLQDKLIKFNVYEKESSDSPTPYYNGANLFPVTVNNIREMNTTYHPYPLITLNSETNSLNNFKKNLSDDNWYSSGVIEGISRQADDVPPFVLVKGEDGILAMGEVTDHQRNLHNDMSYNFKNGLDIYTILEEDLDDIVFSNNDVAFITNRLGQKIEENLLLLNDSNIEPIEEDKNIDQEKQFLKQFNEVLSNRGLVYKEEDIINFHTSVKSSYLTILSGMSGTGKSKIIQAYAQALKLESEFKIIPVSPAWTEDSDLVGYADTLNMIYRPSETEIVDILTRAANYKDSLFIICLDEMNLARVEHYFSQFLSVLEADEERRKLTLYNKELQNRIYNSSQYNYEVPIYNNVRFIGTVNIDESTHEFSNKVLDRSNVITLGVEPFQKIAEASEVKSKKILDTMDFKDHYIKMFINRDSKISLNSETIKFIQELHNLLYEVNIHFGIGPRIFKQIDNYMKNIPKDTTSFSLETGLDYQVKQRILTKIRGSKEELITLLGDYNFESRATEKSEIIQVLEKYRDISGFKESKSIIIQKAKELSLNGYTF